MHPAGVHGEGGAPAWWPGERHPPEDQMRSHPPSDRGDRPGLVTKRAGTRLVTRESAHAW